MRPAAILTAALGVLALGSLALLGRAPRRPRGQRAGTPPVMREPLQRWEGEGGNLAAAPRTVNPATVPADTSA